MKKIKLTKIEEKTTTNAANIHELFSEDVKSSVNSIVIGFGKIKKKIESDLDTINSRSQLSSSEIDNDSYLKNIDIEVIFDDYTKMTIPIDMKDMEMISPYIKAATHPGKGKLTYRTYLLYSIAPSLIEFFEGINLKVKGIYACDKVDKSKITYIPFGKD